MLPPADPLKAAKPIDTDRPCPRCDYNLRGLKAGERCPECGTPILIGSASRFGDYLTGAPLSYLLGMRRAACLLLVGLALGLPLLFWMLVDRARGGSSVLASAAFLLPTVLWAFAVHRINSPRAVAAPARIDHTLEWRWLRLANRATQWCWVGAGVLWLLDASIVNVGGASGGYWIVSIVLGGAAYVGLIGVCIHASLLSDWADDTSLSEHLRIAAFALLLNAPLFALAVWRVSVVGGPLTLLGAGIAVALFGVCLVYILFRVVQFARMLMWAAANREEALSSDRRRSAKVVKRIEEGRATAPGAPVPSPAPIPLAEPPAPSSPTTPRPVTRPPTGKP